MQSAKLIIAVILAAALSIFLPGRLKNLSINIPNSPPQQSEKRENPETLARCLADKGFVMYGTDWCTSCKKQRKLFGRSFKYIKEINCDKNQKLCRAKGIKGYPVWEDASGRQYPGAFYLEQLAEFSGCEAANSPNQNPQTVNYKILITAFLAGLLSFIAPCLLPLLPSYFSSITGFTFREMYGLDFSRLRPRFFFSSIFFVLGFALVFSLLGAAAGTAGQFINTKLPLIVRVSGAILIVFGLTQIGAINFKSLRFDYAWRVQKKLSNLGYITSVITGIVSALVWIPCISPALGSILLIAANSQTTTQGIFLLFTYSLGIGAPFILASLFFPEASSFLQSRRRILHYLSIAAGIIMIAFGLLLVVGKYQEYISLYKKFLF